MTVLAALLAQAVLANGCPAAPPAGSDWVDEVNPIDAIAPEFPEIARGLGSRAVCWVSFDVTERGQPANFCTRCNVVIDTGPTEAMTRAAARFTGDMLAHESRLAVSQWRFGPEHSPYQCSRAAFHFLLEEHDATDLPADPLDVPCLEIQAS